MYIKYYYANIMRETMSNDGDEIFFYIENQATVCLKKKKKTLIDGRLIGFGKIYIGKHFIF